MYDNALHYVMLDRLDCCLQQRDGRGVANPHPARREYHVRQHLPLVLQQASEHQVSKIVTGLLEDKTNATKGAWKCNFLLC